MTETYTVRFQSYGNLGFLASVDGLRGMVEQADSPRGALDKIIVGLRLKFAYDKNVDISKVIVTEQSDKKPANKEHVEKKLIVKEQLEFA